MNRRLLIFSLLYCSLATQLVWGQAEQQELVKQKHNTSDFVLVQQTIDSFLKDIPARKILLVVDIDNTLLAMNQDLGSDQWFTWQESLLEDNPDSPALVAPDFGGLLRVQGILFSLSGMHPPDPNLPDMLKQIQDQGVATVVLTSRGPAFRDASERELKNSGYRFDQEENRLVIVEKRGTFVPYDASQPDAHGLSKETMHNLGAPREVSYANGIYMTAGQHKGFMLKTLLARAVVSRDKPDEKREFEAILFVDDHEKHTERMHDAFESDELSLVTFHYMQEDGNVANFDASSKQHVIRDWNRLDEFIQTVLVK